MLVVTRKVNEKVIIGDNIEVMVISVREGKLQIGITAPRDVAIHREEVYNAIKARETHVEIAAPTPHELPLESDGGPTIEARPAAADGFDHSQFDGPDLSVLGITSYKNKPR